MNSISISGNLGKDCEIRFLPNGDPVCSFSVADSMGRDKANEIFRYDDGRLYWRVFMGPRAVAGTEAGFLGDKGYICIQCSGVNFKAHQLVYLMHHGFIPKEIDHINGNRVDNRISNLRPVTRSQNCANQKTQERSKSGFKGVTYVSRLGKWRARIRVNRREIYLGLFDDINEAAHAYNASALKHFGEYAATNKGIA